MLNFSKFINDFYLFKNKVRFQFSQFFRGWAGKIYLISFFIVNILEWLLSFYINKESEGSRIALHYTVDFGIDYYDFAFKIYILPFLGMMIFIINFSLLLSLFQHKARSFIFHLLLSIIVFANIILLAALISIYLVNFR